MRGGLAAVFGFFGLRGPRPSYGFGLWRRHNCHCGQCAACVEAIEAARQKRERRAERNRALLCGGKW